MLDSLTVMYVQFVIMLTIRESAKCLDNIKHQQTEIDSVFVYQDYGSPVKVYRTRNYEWEPLTFLLHFK